MIDPELIQDEACEKARIEAGERAKADVEDSGLYGDEAEDLNHARVEYHYAELCIQQMQ